MIYLKLLAIISHTVSHLMEINPNKMQITQIIRVYKEGKDEYIKITKRLNESYTDDY